MTEPEERAGQIQASFCTVSLVCFNRGLYFLCVLCRRSELQNFREPEVQAVTLGKCSRAWMHWEIVWWV